MAYMAGHHKIAKEICDSLGIKNATELTIRIAANEIVTVTVKFLPEDTNMEKIPELLKRFALVPLEDESA